MLAKFHIFEMIVLADKQTPNTTPNATVKTTNPTEYAGNLSAGAVVAPMIVRGNDARIQTHTETKAAPIPIATFKKVFIVFPILSIREPRNKAVRKVLWKPRCFSD